jgi:hypothetical protein
MTLALYHRCEVEIVEAECLPSSSRGGKPDPFVVVSYGQHGGLKHRTKVIANTNSPVFGQKFVVESRERTTDIRIAVFDRHDDAEGLLGHADLFVGPPTREVGCRWVTLTPARQIGSGDSQQQQPAELAPKVRLVWQCTDVMLAVEQANDPSKQQGGGGMRPANEAAGAPAGRGEPELTSTTRIGEDGKAVTTRPPDGSAQRQRREPEAWATDDGITGDSTRVTPVQAQIITRLTKIEDTLSVFIGEVRVRLSKLEGRLGDVESVIQNAAQRQPAGAAVDGAEKPGSYWARRSHDDSIASGDVSTSVIMRGDHANAVSKAAGEPSALEAIRRAPTRVAADDERLLANYTFRPVHIPEHIGGAHNNAASGAPTAAGHFAHKPSAEEARHQEANRRLGVATKAVRSSYDRMVNSN